MLSTPDIIKAVIEREEVSIRVYKTAMDKVQDPVSRLILKQIVGNGQAYLKMLEKLKTNGVGDFCPLRVKDSRISESVEFRGITEFSTAKDVLLFAMEREQLAARTYDAIACDASDPAARRLFEFLSLEKLKHKRRIETLCDDLVHMEEWSQK